MPRHGIPEYGHDRAEKAFQRIWQRGRMSRDDLDLIVEAARWGGPDWAAVEWLRKLGTRHAAACEVIEALSLDSGSLARRVALLSLSAKTPTRTKQTVLQRALNDAEPLLREEAASLTTRLRCDPSGGGPTTG